MHLQQMQLVSDGVDQPDPPRQRVDRADLAMTDRRSAVGDVVVNVPGSQHRHVAGDAGVPGAESFFDASFASCDLSGCNGAHSKRLRVCKRRLV